MLVISKRNHQGETAVAYIDARDIQSISMKEVKEVNSKFQVSVTIMTHHDHFYTEYRYGQQVEVLQAVDQIKEQIENVMAAKMSGCTSMVKRVKF